MAPLDPTVASILDKTLTTHPTPSSASASRSRSSSLDADDLLATLDDSPALQTYRETRIAQLTTELHQAAHARSLSHGTYSTLTSEKTVMDLTTSTPRCVVHFFKPDFARCGVMDAHLEKLAAPHYECRFLRIDVAHAPFLVERLGVRVLPCVLGFVEGACVERVVGFEGLGGGGDGFVTRDLEGRLVRAGVLVRGKVVGTGEDGGEVRGRGEVGEGKEVEEDDDDWD